MGLVHPKIKSDQYVLTLMLMLGKVKFFSQQNTAGVSQEKGTPVISQITEANGDSFSNIRFIS